MKKKTAMIFTIIVITMIGGCGNNVDMDSMEDIKPVENVEMQETEDEKTEEKSEELYYTGCGCRG